MLKIENIFGFGFELNGNGFESRCYHSNVRYGAYFEPGVP